MTSRGGAFCPYGQTMAKTKTQHGSRFRGAGGGRGPELAKHAEQHDREGTFVEEALSTLRDAGLMAAGRAQGARRAAAARSATWRWCSASWPATARRPRWPRRCTSTWWRSPRGASAGRCRAPRRRCGGWPRRASSSCRPAARDQTHPKGEATKVDGGYKVSGRKVFCSQSPAGTVMSTMFAYDDPEQGRRVLNMAVPIAAEGVTVLDDWDTMGMRGTGSNSIVIEDVFVPDERVLGQPAPRRARPAVPGDPLAHASRSSAASTSAWPRRRSTLPARRPLPRRTMRSCSARWA